MGNKQQNKQIEKQPPVLQEKENSQSNIKQTNKKQKITIKEKHQIKQKKKGDALCGCFGASKSKNKTKQTKESKQNKVGSQKRLDQRKNTIHQAKKSQITVATVPNAKIDENLFQGYQKQLIDIRLNRKQPYQILKDSDYFDSDKDDKQDLKALTKTYENCEIANYKTPEIQKLQTVRVKTYLFDRNLTKMHV